MTTPTGILFNDPRPKPLSTNGTFQAGCYYQFYTTGTLSLTNVYADATLATPLSQTPGAGQPSTTADSAGRCNPIYLDPNILYRVRLLSSTGIQLEDTDPYVVPGILTLTADVLGSYLYGTTAAETAAGVTPTHFAFAPGDIRRYGATLASSDNTSALQQAINQSAQSTQVGVAEVYIPPGTWNFASVSSANQIAMASNVSIRGAGREVAILNLTGTNVNNGFFVGANLVNVRMRAFTLIGNSQANSFTTGGAVLFTFTSAATGTSGNYLIEDVAFRNFKANYWVYFASAGTAVQTYGMRKIRVVGCDFTSLTGNAQNPSSIGTPSANVAIIGGFTPSAIIQDVEVTGCTTDATFIKQFFINWGGTARVNAHHNFIKNCGTDSSIPNDTGAYAFLVYQQNHAVITAITAASSAVVTATAHGFSNGDYVSLAQIYDAGFSGGLPGTLMAALNDQTFGPISGVTANTFTIPVNTSALSAYSSGGTASNITEPDLCEINCNTIDGVRSCGVYAASPNRIAVNDNIIQGQTDNTETSLFKGAIVSENGRVFQAVGNQITACQNGIHFETRMHIGCGDVRDTTFKNMLTGAQLIKFAVTPNTVTGTVGDTVNIENNTLSSTNGTEIGIYILATATYGNRNVNIRGNHIECANDGILMDQVGSGDSLIQELSISGNTMLAGNVGTIRLGTCTTPNIVISDNTFKPGLKFNNAVDGQILVSATKAVVYKGNVHTNPASWAGGSWVRLAGMLAGTQMEGNRFIQVPDANRISPTDANDVGRSAPNWTGTKSDFCQDCFPVEAGAAASKYVRLGWTYDGTAWREVRALTGN